VPYEKFGDFYLMTIKIASLGLEQSFKNRENSGSRSSTFDDDDQLEIFFINHLPALCLLNRLISEDGLTVQWLTGSVVNWFNTLTVPWSDSPTVQRSSG
jgi:hypothetical protein